MKDAKYWDSMLAMIQRKWGSLGGLLGHFSPVEDESREVGSTIRLLVLQSDRNELLPRLSGTRRSGKGPAGVLHQPVYGMSADLHQTVERVDVDDSNYCRFRANASGNGRVLDMMRRVVLYW